MAAFLLYPYLETEEKICVKYEIRNELIRQGKFNIIDICVHLTVKFQLTPIMRYSISSVFKSWIQFHVLGCKSTRHSQQMWEESLTTAQFISTAFRAFCPLSNRGFTFWRRERCWRNPSPAYKISWNKFCSLERLDFLTKSKGVLKRSTKILIVSKQGSRCSGERNTNFGRKSWNKVLNEEQKATAVLELW